MSSNIRIPRICEQCGQEFIAKTTVTKNCSALCRKRYYKNLKRIEKLEGVNSIPVQKKEFIQNKISDKEFLSIAEACQLLGAGRTTLYRMIKAGSIGVAKLGTRTIIKKTELEKLFI